MCSGLDSKVTSLHVCCRQDFGTVIRDADVIAWSAKYRFGPRVPIAPTIHLYCAFTLCDSQSCVCTYSLSSSSSSSSLHCETACLISTSVITVVLHNLRCMSQMSHRSVRVSYTERRERRRRERQTKTCNYIG